MCDLGGEAAKARGRQAGGKRDDGDLGGSFVYGFTTKTLLSTCGPNSSSHTLSAEQSVLNTSANGPGVPQGSKCVSSAIIHHCIVFIKERGHWPRLGGNE